MLQINMADVMNVIGSLTPYLIRIFVSDFRQKHGICVRILHGRHRGIEIDHHDLLISWSVNIVLNTLI